MASTPVAPSQGKPKPAYGAAVLKLGESLPPCDRHAVSVHLPTWKDTVGWATRDPEVISRMKTGYPRFFMPRLVEDLSRRLVQWATETTLDSSSPALLTATDQLALLTPLEEYARRCQNYLESHQKGKIVSIRVLFDGKMESLDDSNHTTTATTTFEPHQDIYAVVYPMELAKEAKAFWQHTGFGVSSRRAEFWLQHAPFLKEEETTSTNGHKRSRIPRPTLEQVDSAFTRLKDRIYFLYDKKSGEDSIFLYPTGMSAISHSAQAVIELRGGHSKTCHVVVFGFLYVDTFKVLSKIYGFDCKLYGHATLADLEQLEADLEGGMQADALYTEFPGNPLLGCVDLDKLYELANKYDFLLVVDDTVATPVNVDLVNSCDIICTSLTKMFSGACNVMGGSITLNGSSTRWEVLRRVLRSQEPRQAYFPDDVVEMETNSEDFELRVTVASQNAYKMASILAKHQTVAKVYYPSLNPSSDVYRRFQRPYKGYGFLLSIQFKTPAAAIAFHDAFWVSKGPSLGTNFTLCSAYTLFAHYSELEWAAEYGVTEHLVRISAGVEMPGFILPLLVEALEAAAATVV